MGQLPQETADQTSLNETGCSEMILSEQKHWGFLIENSRKTVELTLKPSRNPLDSAAKA